MHTHVSDAPRPNSSPAVQTFRRRHPLSVAAGVVALAVMLAACGSSDTKQGTEPQSTRAAASARLDRAASPPARAVTVASGGATAVWTPDLTDPVTRKEFACSFAEGYFTEAQ